MSRQDRSTSQDRFARLFRRGTQRLHNGEVEKATKLLERAHQIDPFHVDLAINLGGAYILSKKFKKAVDLLEPISKQDPDHVMVWTNLGAAYLGNPILARDEEQKKAITAFENALSLNPTAPNIAYNIGLIYRDRQEADLAIHWFQKAVTVDQNDNDAKTLISKLQNNK
ncbi:MAG: tetratricopeptide repeat protein [Chloroflexi bacterium]|nr:tetratricopeptide repeat protein [Chloroflexota bacterium]